MITLLAIVGALFMLGLIAHAAWVLYYLRSGRGTIDQRMKEYVQR